MLKRAYNTPFAWHAKLFGVVVVVVCAQRSAVGVLYMRCECRYLVRFFALHRHRYLHENLCMKSKKKNGFSKTTFICTLELSLNLRLGTL